MYRKEILERMVSKLTKLSDLELGHMLYLEGRVDQMLVQKNIKIQDEKETRTA